MSLMFNIQYYLGTWKTLITTIGLESCNKYSWPKNLVLIMMKSNIGAVKCYYTNRKYNSPILRMDLINYYYILFV